MANGRVITGYSMPKVAVYSYATNTVTYTGLTPLARGVSVSMDVETSDSTDFYADNVLAESAGGRFTGGTVTLTVDGLKDAARKLIQGLPTETSMSVSISGTTTTVKVLEYDDRQSAPYVGIGFVVRYMENGVTSYVPVVLTKCVFDVDTIDAETQGENIDFQTAELTATIARDDTTNHRWRRIGEAQTTEAAAEAVIAAMLA